MPPKPTLKILMLHGYTQSGPLFRAKVRALEKNLIKAFPTHAVSFAYPTAPLSLQPADIPVWDAFPSPYASAATGPSAEARAAEDEPEAYAWWTRKGTRKDGAYEHLEFGLEFLKGVLLKDGPFDGVLGFSQGGALAGILASLLEPGRHKIMSALQDEFEYPKFLLKEDGETPIHPAFKFAVSYSGFAAENPLYRGFYHPKIQTPMLHFIGSLDTVVEERRSRLLVDACTAQKVVYHPGGHFVPASQREFVGALVSFIREVLGGGSGAPAKKEQSVEDMDLPFGDGRL